MYAQTQEETTQEFSVEETKTTIERLLKAYRTKKDDLEWADDEWESSEIQEELDGYAKKIKILKAQLREHEHATA